MRNLRKITVAMLIFLMIAPVFAQMKKRVAVFSFEDKTDKRYFWWDGRHPGDGMADMLTTHLVKSGKYTVIEREQIESIMQEQNMGLTGRITEQSAAQLGKLLGVEIAIFGAVTEFGQSQKDLGGSFGGFGVGVKTQKATVAVDVRMVNTNTGVILAAENVRKEQSAKGLKFNTPDGRFNNSSDFDNSLVGKATSEAIEDIVTLIDNQAQDMPWEGKIIKVSGSTIYIKPGKDAGVKTGDVFAIYSKGEELIDPDTGISLGSEEEKIGSIKITSVMAKAAKAVSQSGSGFKTGDMVRKN